MRLNADFRPLALAALFLGFVASAGADSPSSNILVRFTVAGGGTNVGRLDVELFAQDKPETVQNFLLYLRGGAYSNGLLHRCDPGFVLQGGGFTLPASPDTNRFSTFRDVRSLGRILNEFDTGPRLSNTFGTLAMARVGGVTNSATSQWFFNLADNSAALDALDGGFTVFGRVLDATNALDGTNLLAFFNALAPSNGIVNLPLVSNAYPAATYGVFNELPVNFAGWRAPQNNELFTVRVEELNPPSLNDVFPPLVQVLTPAENERVTNATVTLSGTTSDDTTVARVLYRFQSNEPVIATGTHAWSAVLDLVPGTNAVTVEAVDCAGRRSLAPVRRSFVYAVRAPLDLRIEGTGRVLGATNAGLLELGRNYTVTAVPRRGHLFQCWTVAVGTNDFTTNAARFTFTMQSNLTLTARFIANPFPARRGAYTGIFDNGTNAPVRDRSGFISLSLGSGGRFSGSMNYDAGNYVFTGGFNAKGAATLRGNLAGGDIVLSLLLDLTNTAGRITGSLIDFNNLGRGGASVELDRAWSSMTATNAPQAGRYTFLIPGAQAADAPGGSGFGAFTVDRRGRVRLSGTLGDAIPLTRAASISAQGRWPLYATLYGGHGSIAGWVNFSTNAPGGVEASLKWFKAAHPSPRYAAGFSNEVVLLGSRYTPPPRGARVLDLTNALVLLEGGNLSATLTNRVTLETNHTVTVNSGNEMLALRVVPATGVVQGSFVHPLTQQPVTLRGIAVQGLKALGGLFLGTTETGGFSLVEE
jgi:cyclophilin family peptidyl-prolyl cis-trans isomerase